MPVTHPQVMLFSMKIHHHLFHRFEWCPLSLRYVFPRAEFTVESFINICQVCLWGRGIFSPCQTFCSALRRVDASGYVGTSGIGWIDVLKTKVTTDEMPSRQPVLKKEKLFWWFFILYPWAFNEPRNLRGIISEHHRNGLFSSMESILICLPLTHLLDFTLVHIYPTLIQDDRMKRHSHFKCIIGRDPF